MHLSSIPLLGLIAAAAAHPALEQRDDPQTVHLTLYGGPDSYSMEFPADGTVRETSTLRAPPPLFTAAPYSPALLPGMSREQPANTGKDNDIAVSVIDAPDYFAQSHCTFETDGKVALQGAVAPDGTQQVLVGPPQPIRAVSCEGVCLPTYGASSFPPISLPPSSPPRYRSSEEGEVEADGHSGLLCGWAACRHLLRGLLRGEQVPAVGEPHRLRAGLQRVCVLFQCYVPGWGIG